MTTKRGEATRQAWLASDFTCDDCYSKLIDHPDAGTIADGHSGYEYLCPNCGGGWNVPRH